MPTVDPNQLLQLHDIHLPAAASWWPPAPGWWLIGIVLLAGLLWAGYHLLARFKKWRWQKRILAEFGNYHARIEQMDDAQLTTVISRHLRQLALTLFPASEVASLSGTGWLEFLETHSQHKGFFLEPGRYLVEAPYHPLETPLSLEQKKQLLQLARNWASYNIEQYSARQRRKQ